MNNGGFAQGSLFDDIRAVEVVETAVTKENNKLKRDLQIAIDCIQQLKKELFSAEESRRTEVVELTKENNQFRTAFSIVSAALKQAQRENAANIRWKNFYKADMEASWWLFQNEENENKKLQEEVKKLKEKAIQPQRVPLFVPGGGSKVAKAACISPAIGK